jgi:hypothetical protein
MRHRSRTGSRRAFRRTALVLSLSTMAAGLSACSKDDATQSLVLAAIDKSAGTARTFVFVDQDLSHRTTVTGEVADSLRYKLLLDVDGRPVWQQIVRDDAIANLFLDTSKVTSYAGSGSSPAVNVVNDYQAIRSFLPPGVPPPPFDQLPKTRRLSPSLALASLQAGKWVVDPAGAPVLPSVGTATEKLATSPFLRPLLMLAAVRAEVAKLQPPQIQRWQKDDISPTYKPQDDPFPDPKPNEDRYDVAQLDLPQITATSRDSRPEAPPDEALRKLAIYIDRSDGRVTAIRENFDILDRLEDMARLYQIPLILDKSSGKVTQQRIGQLLVQLVQASRPVPYRVHEEQLILSYPTSAPQVALPKPAVNADLSLFPGQGKAAAAGVEAEEAGG